MPEALNFLQTFDIATLSLMIGAAFVTALVHSAGGFSGGMLLLMCLTPIMGLKTAVPVAAVAVVVSNITRTFAFRNYISWWIFKSLMITALPGMFIGALLFVYLPGKMIALILGSFLIISVPLRRYFQARGFKVTPKGFAAIGTLYGMLSGATMGAGVLLAPFFLGAGLVGPQLVAMNAVIGVVLNVVKITVFGFSPLLSLQFAALGLLLGVFTIPGAFIGRWIVKRTKVHVHVLIVEATIWIGGIYFLSRAF